MIFKKIINRVNTNRSEGSIYGESIISRSTKNTHISEISNETLKINGAKDTLRINNRIPII